MGQPAVYYGNLLQSGTAGTKGIATETEFFPIDPDNPDRYEWDGSILMPHTPSGTLYAGGALRGFITEVVLTDASLYAPTAWCYYGATGPDAATFSGRQWSSFGGGSWTLTDTAPINTSGLIIMEFINPWQSDRNHTGIEFIGLAAWQVPVVYEHWIATKWTMPRSPQVGVERRRVRQYSRLPVPNGQPFVKRNGPMLRETTYTAVMLSGSEINAFNAMLAATDGGQVFPFKDDHGDEYVAELVGSEIAETDTAGVYQAALSFREVKPEGLF